MRRPVPRRSHQGGDVQVVLPRRTARCRMASACAQTDDSWPPCLTGGGPQRYYPGLHEEDLDHGTATPPRTMVQERQPQLRPLLLLPVPGARGGASTVPASRARARAKVDRSVRSIQRGGPGFGYTITSGPSPAASSSVPRYDGGGRQSLMAVLPSTLLARWLASCSATPRIATREPHWLGARLLADAVADASLERARRPALRGGRSSLDGERVALLVSPGLCFCACFSRRAARRRHRRSVLSRSTSLSRPPTFCTDAGRPGPSSRCNRPLWPSASHS